MAASKAPSKAPAAQAQIAPPKPATPTPPAPPAPTPTTDTPPAEATVPATEAPKTGAVTRSANVDEFNFDEEMVETKKDRAPRVSKWAAVLSRLYDATAAGSVKGGNDGQFKYTRIGHFINENGARTQRLILLKNDEFAAAYDFKALPTPKGAPWQTSDERPGCDLWARVKVIMPVEDAPPAE